jgi:hypothetical protein
MKGYSINLNKFDLAMHCCSFVQRAAAHILLDEYAYTNGKLSEERIEQIKSFMAQDLPKEKIDWAIKSVLYRLFEKTSNGYKCPLLDNQLKHVSR